MTQLIKISLKGLSCENCVKTVNNALENVDGVINADTILADAIVNVEYDDRKVGYEDIRKAVEDSGYGVVE